MMPRLTEITPSRTYKTPENAVKAVEKLFANYSPDASTQKEVGTLRYFIHQSKDGRYFPVFIGMKALTLGVHFHFNVVG